MRDFEFEETKRNEREDYYLSQPDIADILRDWDGPLPARSYRIEDDIYLEAI